MHRHSSPMWQCPGFPRLQICVVTFRSTCSQKQRLTLVYMAETIALVYIRASTVAVCCWLKELTAWLPKIDGQAGVFFWGASKQATASYKPIAKRNSFWALNWNSYHGWTKMSQKRCKTMKNEREEIHSRGRECAIRVLRFIVTGYDQMLW